MKKDGPTYEREDSLEGEAGVLQGILHFSLNKADICTTTLLECRFCMTKKDRSKSLHMDVTSLQKERMP
jgi:hypothetical protein